MIAFWGASMVLLGIAQGQVLWIPLGIAVLAVGAPMLGANPLVAERLYPTRTDRDHAP